MQAIKTRYLGATNFKPSRIKAECQAGSVIVSYDHALSEGYNHRVACEALLTKMKWDTVWYGPMIAGQFGGDYYWVFAGKDNRFDITQLPVREE